MAVCPVCGGRGQVERPRGGLLGRFRTPDLERCTRCNGSGSIQPKTEMGGIGPRPGPGPSGAATKPPVSPKTGTRITLDRILTVAPDKELQETIASLKKLEDCTSPEQRSYKPPPINSARVSSTEYFSLSGDGSVIVTRRYFDGRLFVIDANTRETISSFNEDGGRWFQLSHTGRELAVLAKNRRSVILYDLETWQPIRQTPEAPANEIEAIGQRDSGRRRHPSDGEIIRFGLSPDGSSVAISYVGGGLRAFSLRDDRLILEKKDTGKIGYLAWSRDSATLAFADQDACNGLVLSKDTGSQIFAWKSRYPHWIAGLDFTSDGLLIAGDNLGNLNRIDIRAQTIQKLVGFGAATQEDVRNGAPVMAISAAPNGSIVAVGRGDGSVELWDISERRLVASATGHANSVGVSKYVECIQWFPDGRRLCTWGGYDTRIWSISI
jgi:WD40 repeat protein